MKKTFILTALIVLTALPSNAGFAENSCSGQEVTMGIVPALGWELWDELLTLEVVCLPSSSRESTCPPIGDSLLSLVKYIL